MKILLLTPSHYSLDNTIRNGFAELGHEIIKVDYPEFFYKWYNKLMIKTSGLPRRITRHWYDPYIKKVNKRYCELTTELKPDFVLVYNDQLILPETIKKIKKRCPVFNFLGDNPFYLFNRPSSLASLMEMSYIFAPDTFWIKQISILGIKNIDFLIWGYDGKLNYPFSPSENDLIKYKSDLVMIGSTYRTNWGYKRALFYNQFADLDIKIYGKGWGIWFDHFPKLEEKYAELNKPLSFEEVNNISNCSKIYPVDANPGLLNGIHIRIFDCIGSGILPIVEYREDVRRVFKEVEIPIIFDYQESKEIALYYLNNDEERIKKMKELKNFVDKNYTPAIAAKQIIKVYNSL